MAALPSRMPAAVPGRESPEQIASVALEFGRLLMEAGAGSRGVEEITVTVATGLGAERADLRVGYASLALTIGLGPSTTTQMRKVGALGVNQSLGEALRLAAARIGQGGFTAAQAREELDWAVRASPRHADWIVALAVGVACAAFGRLLGADWAGVAPIFAGATLGQMVRRRLALRHFNVFLSATVVGFLAATLAGLAARWAGSQTVTTVMMAAVLLLVPGVPALNMQHDILEGRPTLGSARAVWVVVLLFFMTVGVWLAQGLLREGR